MLNSQVVLLENGKKRAEDNVQKLEKQMEGLQQKAFERWVQKELHAVTGTIWNKALPLLVGFFAMHLSSPESP